MAEDININHQQQQERRLMTASPLNLDLTNNSSYSSSSNNRNENDGFNTFRIPTDSSDANNSDSDNNRTNNTTNNLSGEESDIAKDPEEISSLQQNITSTSMLWPIESANADNNNQIIRTNNRKSHIHHNLRRNRNRRIETSSSRPVPGIFSYHHYYQNLHNTENECTRSSSSESSPLPSVSLPTSPRTRLRLLREFQQQEARLDLQNLLTRASNQHNVRLDDNQQSSFSRGIHQTPTATSSTPRYHHHHHRSPAPPPLPRQPLNQSLVSHNNRRRRGPPPPGFKRLPDYYNESSIPSPLNFNLTRPAAAATGSENLDRTSNSNYLLMPVNRNNNAFTILGLPIDSRLAQYIINPATGNLDPNLLSTTLGFLAGYEACLRLIERQQTNNEVEDLSGYLETRLPVPEQLLAHNLTGREVMTPTTPLPSSRAAAAAPTSFTPSPRLDAGADCADDSDDEEVALRHEYRKSYRPEQQTRSIERESNGKYCVRRAHGSKHGKKEENEEGQQGQQGGGEQQSGPTYYKC